MGATSFAECCSDSKPKLSGYFYPGSSTREVDVPCVQHQNRRTQGCSAGSVTHTDLMVAPNTPSAKGLLA